MKPQSIIINPQSTIDNPVGDANSSDVSHASQPEPQATRRTPGAGRVVWVGLAIVLLVSLLALLAWSLRREQLPAVHRQPLPVLGTVPDFTLTERDGRTVRLEDLLGNVWLANFIFTRCSGPCPELSLRMRSVQQSLRNKDPDVRLVSFTLDPMYDTPAVLRAYALAYHADPKRWLFLTSGDEAQMLHLVKEGFMQAVDRGGRGGEIIHSTYFMLVDRMGRMRTVYDGRSAASKPRILEDIDTLLQERSAS